MTTSLDGQLIQSNSFTHYDKVGRFSQLRKLDENGEIIWSTEGNEPFDNGSVPTRVAQLSDSNIVQSYVINEFSWPPSDFFDHPIKLKFYNNQGDSTKAIKSQTPKIVEPILSHLESGKGDYFFAYGAFNDVDDDYALLTKMNLQGDAIWNHKYQHPDYSGTSTLHLILDIEEKDSGDIVILSQIYPVGQKSLIWLFSVNSDGCMSDDPCDDPCDEIIVDNINTPDQKNELELYPNPATNKVHVDHQNIDSYTIVDLQGKMVIRQQFLKNQVIDVSELTPALYFIIFYQHDEFFSSRIIQIVDP